MDGAGRVVPPTLENYNDDEAIIKLSRNGLEKKGYQVTALPSRNFPG